MPIIPQKKDQLAITTQKWVDQQIKRILENETSDFNPMFQTDISCNGVPVSAVASLEAKLAHGVNNTALYRF